MERSTLLNSALSKLKEKASKLSTIAKSGFQGVKEDMGRGAAILDIPSAYIAGVSKASNQGYKSPTSLIKSGIEGVAKRYQGDQSYTVFEELPNKLGIKGVPAVAMGLVGELAVPDITDITKVSKAAKAIKNITDETVLQAVEKGGQKSFFRIPTDKLDKIKGLVDTNKLGEVGVAGYKDVDGTLYHLTAKNPQKMVEEGFKDMGVADLPAFEETVNNIRKAAGIDEFGNKVNKIKLKPSGEATPNKIVKQTFRSDKIDPLIQESKKYKSAEEFVKGQDTPKTVRVWNKSKFSDNGAYADIPVISREDNITLYQGSKTGESRQFWTPDKKYAEQFGNVKEKTGAFYKVDNGNRVTNVYVEAPTKSQLTDIWNKAQSNTVGTPEKIKYLKYDVRKLPKDFYQVSPTGAVSVSYDPQSTAAIKKILQDEKIEEDILSKAFKKSAKPGVRLEEVIKTIEKNTNKTSYDFNKLKDISEFEKGFKDVYRNFEKAFGSQCPRVKELVLDPFDAAKGNYISMQKSYLKDLDENVVKRLGIKKGSKLSGLTQRYGEGLLSEEQISKIPKGDLEKIIKANDYFRSKYDELLNQVNSGIARIYPNQPEKLIPRRADYYRHFKEMQEGLGGLLNIFDTPANIPPSLAGISDFTTPKQKWLSIAQQRLGAKTEYDAVGGYLDYIRQASYATHIDPEISKLRNLHDDLVKIAEESENPVEAGKMNNFIEYLNDYANSLAGKTNPVDRAVQKYIPGGRKAFKLLNWLNRRVKANVILGNLSSALAQPFNIPQAAADMGYQNFTKGTGKALVNILEGDTPIKSSSFINERYFKGYDKFDSSLLDNTRKLAAWVTGVLDEVSTKTIWHGYYEKAVSEGIENPIKYADDFTRKMVAGRGVGEVPIMQESKVFQLIAPFQLEVSNLWNVFKDWTTKKEFSKFAKYAVTAYFMNQAVKELRGSDVAFDPINATIEGVQSYKEEENKKMGGLKLAGRLGGEVLSNVPLGQSFAGIYPEYGFSVGGAKLPTRKDLFGEGDPTRFGSGMLVAKGIQDPLYKLLPPFGGQQLKRSIEANQGIDKGYTETPTGRVRFPVGDTIRNRIQGSAFGINSLPEAQKYYESNGTPLGEKQSEIIKNEGRVAEASSTYQYFLNEKEREKAESIARESVKVYGGSKLVGNKFIYQKDGDTKSITIKPEPTGEKDRMKWERESLRNAVEVLSLKIPLEEKNLIISKLGVDPAAAEYYDLASEENRIKTAFVMESLSTYKDRGELITALVKLRRPVAGKYVLANGVIDDLVDNGIISKDEAKALKDIEPDESGKLRVKMTGRGKTAKLKKISLPKINIKLQKIEGLKAPRVSLPRIEKPSLGSIKVSQPEYKIKFNL